LAAKTYIIKVISFMMKSKKFFVKFSFILMVMTFLYSCGGSNDSNEDEFGDVTSAATVEYLCSTNLWTYSPDNGINKNEPYQNYSFYRIGEINGCTIMGVNGAEGGKFSFSFNAPNLILKEVDMFSKEIPGGKTFTLNIYKLPRKKYSNQRFLTIDQW
jgi:hypothetical protein